MKAAKERAGFLTSTTETGETPPTDTAINATEQAALDVLIFMGLLCQDCEGRGYTFSPIVREDDYGEEYEDYTCYRCMDNI